MHLHTLTNVFRNLAGKCKPELKREISRVLAGACLLGLSAVSHAQAATAPVEQGPQTGDPARWYVDDNTSAA